MAAAFSHNTTLGDTPMNVHEIFNSPPKTACKLVEGTYEIKMNEQLEGYLFQITPVPDNIGIYSINSPAPDKTPSSYKTTPIGTVENLRQLITSNRFHIINGPGIDVGTMLIHIERVGDSSFYKLICDTSPANGGRGRGSRRGLSRGSRRGRSRGSRRGNRRGSRRGRSRRNSKKMK